MFEYNNFSIVSSVTSYTGNSNNVYANISAPASWNITNRTQYLGTINQNQVVNVTWQVNATTYGSFNVSVFVNGTNSTLSSNDTYNTTNFTVYRLFAQVCPDYALNGTNITERVCAINATLGQQLDNVTSEAGINPGQNLSAYWLCDAGDYRLGEITSYMESNMTSSKARFYVYNGTGWQDILHSLDINSTVTSIRVPFLRSQLYANETGYCNVRIQNIGNDTLFVDYLALKDYYFQRKGRRL